MGGLSRTATRRPALHLRQADAELARLDQAWADGTNALAIIAWSSVGKTAQIAHWIKTRFVESEWREPDDRPSPLAEPDQLR